MSRRTRIEAARLAAQVMQGAGHEDGAGARTFALCVLFENYIDLGADKADEMMKILPDGEVTTLRLIKGRKP